MSGTEPKIANQAQPSEFVIILKSKARQWMQSEKLKLKRGKSRKLTKADKDQIEEELNLMRFNPERMRQQALQEAFSIIQKEELEAKEFRAQLAQVEVNELKQDATVQHEAAEKGEALAEAVAEKSLADAEIPGVAAKAE